ncbi:MAG: hypothetical protein RL477_1507 [Pseudomonadota bacterium]
MRFLFWIIALPVLALAGAFAAANPGPLALRFWPLPYEVTVPVYAAVLGAFFAGLLLASLWFWFASLPGRFARRRLARHERELEAETRRLKDELAVAERRRMAPDSEQRRMAPATDDDARRRLIAGGD